MEGIKMKIETYKNEIPGYALSYLINGDHSGIDDADIKNTDEFMKEFYDYADEINGHVVVDVIDEEGSFNAFPAFGLACDTFKCNINILY
jgi:hypothetical protein